MSILPPDNVLSTRAAILEFSSGFSVPKRVFLFSFSFFSDHMLIEEKARMKSDRVPIKKQGIAAPKKPQQLVEPPRSSQGYHSSQPSQPSSSQPEVPELGIEHFMQNSERFSPRDAEKLVEAWGTGEKALSKMPKADQPERLQSTLLPYQLQGLQWMLEKENPVLPAVGSTDIVQLWKRSPGVNNAFQNIATHFSTKTAPVLARGGILADDMGLGKTLQVISLILTGRYDTSLARCESSSSARTSSC